MHNITSIYPWQLPQWQQLHRRRIQGILPHALLLRGASGLGKLHFGLQLAASLLCDNPTDNGIACGECTQCHLVEIKTHPDFFVIQPELDNGAIKVDSIRRLITSLQETCQCAKTKIALIEPAEAMNRSAANCLLKVLEEPPPQVILILISNYSHLLIPTIRSRCQSLSFYPMGNDQIKEWLKATSGQSGDKFGFLLHEAHGAPLKALRLLEEDYPAFFQLFSDNLNALTLKQITPLQMAEQWMKKPLQTIIDCFLNLVMDLIEMSLIHGDKPSDNKNLIVKGIHSGAISIKKLYDFFDKLLQVRQFMIKKLNCNLQLLLEDLFIEWILCIK